MGISNCERGRQAFKGGVETNMGGENISDLTWWGGGDGGGGGRLCHGIGYEERLHPLCFIDTVSSFDVGGE